MFLASNSTNHNMADQNDEHTPNILPAVTRIQRPSGLSPNMLPLMANLQSASYDKYHSSNGDSMDTAISNTLDEFILDALKKPADRLFLLGLEDDLKKFINNPSINQLELGRLNSYYRRLVYKAAPFFFLHHWFDSSRQLLVLYKTLNTAIPADSFAVLVPDPKGQEELKGPLPKFQIMRREQPNHARSGKNSFGQGKQAESKENTLEERKAAYDKARARIFKDFASDEAAEE